MTTFVIRIHDSPGLHGVLEDVASGIKTTFRDADELLAVLLGSRQAAAPIPASAVATDLNQR